MAYAFGNTSLKRLEGVNPYLIECAQMTILESRFDLAIPWMGGVRTREEQNAIFKEGNSKCDGYKVLSYHQIEAADNGYGNALDIIPAGPDPYNDFAKLNATGRLMLINWQELIFKYAREGVDIGVMIWGGTFGSTSWDRPHFEVRN
jgi:peptidoglycan LD-endopeptidase CwlK